MIIDREIIRFEWDEGNRDKNLEKDNVTSNESEEVFFDINKQEYPDPTHLSKEQRKIVIGLTKKHRLLFIVYIKRRKKIRVISARDLNKKKEGSLYEKVA